MSALTYTVSPVDMTNSEPLGQYNIVSFKDWVDAKYSSNNLIAKYQDSDEMREFLQDVVETSEKYGKIIIPEYEQDFIPDMDLTKAVIKGHIVGSSYFEDGVKIPARDFLNSFIKDEIMTGETSLNYLRLINIISS